MDTRERFLDAAITEPSVQPVETIIDAHTHIGQVRVDALPVSPSRLVEYMNAHGVDQAVVHPLVSPLSTSHYVTTRDVLSAVASYPDRLIPFCSVDPRMYYRWGKDRYAAVIREYVELGARGFGELKCDLPLDHEYMHVLYEICADEGLPVLIHIDSVCCTDAVGLPAVESLLQQYPGVDFVFHAPGWWAHISGDVEQIGGYPDGPVEPGGRCDALLGTYDNCWADFSMTSGFNALTRDEIYGETFLRRHHESLLFGSDYLQPGQSIMQFGFFSEFDLEPYQWEQICSKNIRSILA
ncbi:amidohydrolase family protein [Halocatena halophila]|uniref:amidohydrolase family protein n=1 Tax=Halocatena halophila TaxID=2814576 RepID=UPI002ED5B531